MRLTVQLLFVVALAAQQPPTSLTVTTPAPPAPTSVTATYVGAATGGTDLFYFAVARYPAGMAAQTTPGIAQRTAGVANLAANNVRVNWTVMTGATSYDVLRSTTPAFPGSGCTCAVALNTTATTFLDNGPALQAWPAAGLSFAQPVTMTITVNNVSESRPYLNVLLNSLFRLPLIDPNNGITASGGFLGPVYPLVAPADPGTPINFSSSSVAIVGNTLVLTGAASVGDNLRLRCMTAPATPYTWTAYLAGMQDSTANAQFGIGFRSSGTLALAVAALDHNSLAGIVKWTNPSLFSAGYAFAPYRLNTGGVWMRIADDGTNRITGFSNDGVNFVSHSVGRTDFLTADQVCIYANPANNDTAIITFYSLQMQ